MIGYICLFSSENQIVLSPVRGTGFKTDPVKTHQAEAVMFGLSPALCAIVVLVTVGSILALAVWTIIYRRRTRLGSTPGKDNLITCFYFYSENI